MKIKAMIAALVLLSAWTAAQDNDRDLSGSPYFEVVTDNATPASFPLRSSSATVSIAGVIANVTVRQEYENKGKEVIEAIYVFPGSTRAAVHSMRMHIGERTIVARIEEKNKARQEYDQAREQGRTASLLEQKRPNVFQMNVANILPGDVIAVEMEYSEMLIPEEGLYRFVYPTVVGPRFANGSEGPATPAGDGWVSNPYTSEGTPPLYETDIVTEINAGMPLSDLRCTSHEVAVNWLGGDRVRLDLKESERRGGNRDYILEYRLRGGQVHTGLLLFEGKEENFFLAMVQPPKSVKPEVIPPREYVFIVDVSGSMSGFPLEVSKALLRDLIGGLRPTDRFNVLLFASGNSVLSERSLPATPDNVRKALELISNQHGGGGTQLLPALQRALALQGTEDFSRSFIIATDGYVTVERQAFELIRDHLGQANFFPFGIGSSVNRHLLEGMAHVGKGEPFVVTSQTEAPEIAKRFREYVQYPVLTNITVDFEGFGAYDVEPSSIPDVLAERPVLIMGKWKGQATGRIVLKGRGGKGPFTAVMELPSMKRTGDNSALRQLWARERIRLLDDFSALGSETQEHTEEVTALGLKYNLLTRFTSFVAVDSEVRNEGGSSRTVVQPLPLPQGVSNQATGNIVTAGAVKKFAPTSGIPNVVTTQQLDQTSTREVLSRVAVEDAVIMEEDREVWSTQQSAPRFKGGEARLKAFLASAFHYPDSLLVTGIHGRIVLEFFVEADGRVADVMIVRGLHPDLDREAIQAVRATSGQWEAGQKGGVPIRVKMRVVVKAEP